MRPRLIPCLDVDGGLVVKGRQFVDLRTVGDPVELARRYEREGADELVLLDISATVQQREAAFGTIAHVAAELSIPFTVGGGVRTVDDAARLMDVGVDKVAINSAAVRDPSLLRRLAARFGTQAVVAAVDVRREAEGFRVVTHGGRSASEHWLKTWLPAVQEYGAGEVLLTSIDRDGTRTGYDIALLEVAADLLSVPLIASGGAGSAVHLKEALAVVGVTGVLLAGILHDGQTLTVIKDELAAMGVPTRDILAG